MPESTVLGGYRIGVRFLWEVLVTEAAVTGGVGSGGSTEVTAKLMFCHPNTIRLRLRRISEHTGRSISQPRDVTELCLARYAIRQAPKQATS